MERSHVEYRGGVRQGMISVRVATSKMGKAYTDQRKRNKADLTSTILGLHNYKDVPAKQKGLVHKQRYESGPSG